MQRTQLSSWQCYQAIDRDGSFGLSHIWLRAGSGFAERAPCDIRIPARRRFMSQPSCPVCLAAVREISASRPPPVGH
jgi:hypothetical protein